MKRLILVSAMVLLAASPLAAQRGPGPIPAAEIFGGASYYRSGISNGINFFGWQGAVDFNVHKNVGVVLDFGGQYKRVGGANTTRYEYMGGPRFKYRTKQITAFVEGLVGGESSRLPGATRGGFAAGGGGGLDVNMGRLVAVRLIQVDSIHVHTQAGWRHDVRAGVGVVFKIPRQ
jgi:hypothetical protein